MSSSKTNKLSKNHNLTLTPDELNSHYQQSSNTYDIQGESHLDYYRAKYPKLYAQLLNL